MKSLFDMGFRRPFMAMPKRVVGLGQDEPTFITSYDQGPDATVDIPGLYTSIDQMPDSTGWDSSGLYTSYDQGPPAESVPGIVTQQDLDKELKAPSASTDWGKVAGALVKGAGESYAAYEKGQATFNAARAKAGLPPMDLKAAAAQSSSAISPNVLFLVGGLAAVSLLVVLIRA
jgi:hypothetical protein